MKQLVDQRPYIGFVMGDTVRIKLHCKKCRNIRKYRHRNRITWIRYL